MKQLILLFCLFLSFTAFAEDKISGYISGGVIILNTDDKLMTDGKAEDADFHALTKIGAMITGEVNYHLSDRTKIHFGAPQTGIIPRLELGVSTTFQNKTEADFSLTMNPFNKVWENPYTAKRHETDAQSYGLGFKLKQIAGTGFFTDISYIERSVSNDKAGEAYETLGRDGYETDFKAGYTFKNGKLATDVFAKYAVGNKDGKAESYKGFGTGVKVSASTKGGDIIIFLLAADRVEYDGANPYFGETREETSYGALALYTLNNIFGFKDKFLTFSGGYGNRDANIEFFDAETFFAGIGAGLNF